MVGAYGGHMNKIFAQNSLKTYQTISDFGTTSNGTKTSTGQKKNSEKQDKQEDFRQILAKKLKAA
jgi:hypothetical protein